MTEDTIAFKRERDTLIPATGQDRDKCTEYGLRNTYQSETAARQACERAGFVYLGPDHIVVVKMPEHIVSRTTVEEASADNAKGKAKPKAKAKPAKAKKPAPEVKPGKHKAAPENKSYPHRETWLRAAIEELRPAFKAAGSTLPGGIRVSCGWPLGTRKAIGQAFSAVCSADGSREIFISPVLSDAMKDKHMSVLPVLVHELCHAALPAKTGHKRPFKLLATAMGLEGKATSTFAGEGLIVTLTTLAKHLGHYPHASLSAIDSERKKQTTRLLKAACETCGYTVRVTAKWCDEVGAPHCPAHGEMSVEGWEEDGEGED